MSRFFFVQLYAVNKLYLTALLVVQFTVIYTTEVKYTNQLTLNNLVGKVLYFFFFQLTFIWAVLFMF